MVHLDGPTEPYLGIPHLWRDLRSGRAGFGIRLGLSAAAAILCFSALMIMIGLVDSRGRVNDEQVFAGVALAIAGWLSSLYVVWGTFPRRRRALKVGFTCMCIWAVAIAISFVLGAALRSPEFFITGTLFAAAGSSVLFVAAAAYQGSRGRKMRTASGTISVVCVQCGYSMSGLDTCTCPECGRHYTLDELIRAQEYEALEHRPEAASQVAGELPAKADPSPA